METRVQKWGNSLALRIPKALADEVGLKNNASVQMTLHDKKLVIELTSPLTFDLDEMLARVTDQNLHSEVDTGPAVGVEIW
jgi:antitoxin MazE